jgi:hypothetical protein
LIAAAVMSDGARRGAEQDSIGFSPMDATPGGAQGGRQISIEIS